MDIEFCGNWKGSGVPPENKHCRECQSEPCADLWNRVKEFASQRNYYGVTASTKTGKRFRLHTTPKQSDCICLFQSLDEKRKGVSWHIPKEDFLYVLKTGVNDTPSRTRQKSHVEPIVDLIRELKNGRELIVAIKKL